MKTESWDDLLEAVLANKTARCAYRENELRRKLATAFDDARKARGLSVREFATQMDSSVSQVQRLLHKDLGGSLTLRTICRAADVLGLHVGIHVRRTASPANVVVDFGTSAWTPLHKEMPEPGRVERCRFATIGSAAIRWQPNIATQVTGDLTEIETS